MLLQFLAAADPTSHVAPHDLFHIGSWFAFTNQMLMALLAGLLMIWIFPKLFDKARSEAPAGPRNFFESILEYLRVEVFHPTLKKHTNRFVPFL